MAHQTVAALDLQRVADEMNVILTEIYGQYVAEGSPTKLGGLRFLDVRSSKTFAFEKSEVADGGNLLVLSAPFLGSKEENETALKSGPHGEDIPEGRITFRGSADVGKADKRFLEVAYFLPTARWLTDDKVLAFAQQHRLVNAREAVTGILKENVLPYAEKVMAHLVELIRNLVDRQG